MCPLTTHGESRRQVLADRTEVSKRDGRNPAHSAQLAHMEWEDEQGGREEDGR